MGLFDKKIEADVKLSGNIGVNMNINIVQQPPPAPEYRAIFTFTMGQFVFKGENMANTMQAGTIATLSVQWTDSKGNPAKVDGATDWVSSDEEIGTVTVSEGNPLIANVYSVGPVGPFQIQATADADLGEGVKTITATCDISVIAGEAFAGTIAFSQSPAQGQPGQRGGAKPLGKK